MSEEEPKHTIVPFPRRRRSPQVTLDMARNIRWPHHRGMMQHDIAALYRINQGRVSEVVNGKRFPE
jgi:hypothetical protein